tara:strand:+ start:5910 stop:7637 length:1728 start_codon:yes stop_codon:yes gene_type:complete
MIEDLGESLLGKQRENIAARDSSRKKQARQLQNQKILGLGGALLGKALMTDAQKKANGFMQREPIMAARAKYNAGVSNSIALIKEGELAAAHAEGKRGYLRDKALPKFTEQLQRAMPNLKNYRKSGAEAWAYEQADNWAAANVDVFDSGVNAAYRVGDDSDAFDNFIKVNDGIADSPIGALGKSIAGIFRGKSEPALQTAIETSLINSKYIKDVDALNAARSLINGGFPVADAAKIAKSMEQHKTQDIDYIETARDETATMTDTWDGKNSTIRGTKITKTNDQGFERVEFIPDEGQGINDPTATRPRQRSTAQETINGAIYDVTTVDMVTRFGIVKGSETTRIFAGLDPSLAGVKDAEADQAGLSFIGSQRAFISPLNPELSIVNTEGGEYFTELNNVDDDVVDAKVFTAGYKNIVLNSSYIKGTTSVEKYPGNAADLHLKIASHIVLNDASRIKTGDGGDTPFMDSFGDQFDHSASIMEPRATTLEILEAVGSINANNDGDVDANYIKSLVGSEKFKQELTVLNQDPRKLTAYLNAFNLYQDDPAYKHLFAPIVTVVSGRPNLSVYEMLLDIKG